MQSEWRRQRLEFLIDFLPKRPIKKGSIAPFVAMADIPENQKNIIHSGDREYKGGGSRFCNGDTLFARITPCLENGKTALVNSLEDGVMAHGSTEFIVMSPRDLDNDRQFVYYLARLPEFRKFAESRMEGTSGRQRVSWQALAEYELSCPPASSRKRIGEILGTLDDKIELNRQMNETLEAIAQALFKSWFVDFDPVIDNALAAGNEIPEPLQKRAAARQALGEQRKPLPAENQSLFPDRFVFTDEMGWVPEGWETQQAETVSEKIGMGPFGSNIKVSTFVDMGVPVISGKHLNKTLLTDAEYNYVTEEHAERLKNSIVKAGDIIFTHAGNIGQVSLIPDESNYSKYVISQRQFYLRPDTSRILSSYLVYFFRSPVGQHKLLANASQVGVPSIARPSSHLKSINLLLPPYGLLREFDKHCKANFEKLISNQRESETLSLLRDALLPKLLSGELSIPGAEKQVAEAV